jgi:hypothetical protein
MRIFPKIKLPTLAEKFPDVPNEFHESTCDSAGRLIGLGFRTHAAEYAWFVNDEFIMPEVVA